jgi:hypothetical protein
MTQLEKLKNVFDELGIKYHELSEDGHTYIQKFTAHDTPGHIYVPGYGQIAIKKAGQLTNSFEFDKKGKIASW